MGRWRDLHAGTCEYFKGVVDPDANAVRREHFYLETGGYGMCR
ncbi:MAG: extensin family protein [Pseudomonadota bacterium]